MALSTASVRSNLRSLLNDETAPYTWSDTNLDKYALEAVKWLSSGTRPALWAESTDSSKTTVFDQYEYALPTGFFAVFDIWVESTSGDATSYRLLTNWRVFNSNFQLAIYDRPSEAGLHFRIRGAKKFTTIAEVPEEYEPIILDYAASRALDAISNEMTQFNTYSAKLQNISRNDVRLKAQYHRSIAMEAKRENKKALKPVYQATGDF